MAELWIPPEQRTTLWYLFNQRFRCRIPYAKSRKISELRLRGLPSTGDAKLDHQISRSVIETMLTVNQIAEYYRDSVQVAVVKHEDTVRIYELIQNHLRDWIRALDSGSVAIEDAPTEDLILLDTLATAVYAHAAPLFTRKTADSYFNKSMARFAGFNRESVMGFKVPEKKIPAEENVVPDIPARRSLAEAFGKTRFGLTRVVPDNQLPSTAENNNPAGFTSRGKEWK